MLLEVDHSSGHTKKLSGGLCTDDMGLGIGGKKLATRDTVITEGCMGETLVYRATWMDGTVEREVIYRRLEINDRQHFVYKDDDQPPYLAPGTPKYDAEVLVPAKRRKGVNGDPIQEMKKISGYVGKNKGIFQILVEKGSCLPGMRGSLAPKQVGRLLAEAEIPHLMPLLSYPAAWILPLRKDFACATEVPQLSRRFLTDRFGCSFPPSPYHADRKDLTITKIVA